MFWVPIIDDRPRLFNGQSGVLRPMADDRPTDAQSIFTETDIGCRDMVHNRKFIVIFTCPILSLSPPLKQKC